MIGVSVELRLPSKPPLDAAALQRAVLNGGRGVARDTLVDFKVVTRSWTKVNPDFRIQETITAGGNDMRWVVGTDASTLAGRIFMFLNGGTKPHLIMPTKVGGVLAFEVGGATVFARYVRHPGTRARNWVREIAAKWRGLWPQVLQRAIDTEIKRP